MKSILWEWSVLLCRLDWGGGWPCRPENQENAQIGAHLSPLFGFWEISGRKRGERRERRGRERERNRNNYFKLNNFINYLVDCNMSCDFVNIFTIRKETRHHFLLVLGHTREPDHRLGLCSEIIIIIFFSSSCMMKKRQSRTASDYELGKRKGSTLSGGGSGDSSSMSYDKRTASTRALIVRTLIVRQNSNASLGTPDDDDDDDSSKKGSLKTSPPVVKNKLASETVPEIFPRSTPTGRKEGRKPDAPTCSAQRAGDPFSASLEIGKKRAETVVNQLRYPPPPQMKKMLILRAQAQSCSLPARNSKKRSFSLIWMIGYNKRLTLNLLSNRSLLPS